MKKILLLLMLLLFTILNASCIKGNHDRNYPLEISFIDVGQGDSILIEYKSKNILIDAGPMYSEKNLIKYLRSKKIKKLDVVISTHPHEDHIGGMTEVIKSFKIGSFYAPKVLSSDESFVTMIKALRDKNIKINRIKKGKTIVLDNEAALYFLSPEEETYENLNNYSAVTLLKYKDSTYLFTGDAESAIEDTLTNNYPKLSVDLIKLGHHGSKTSSSEAFLKSLYPKIAVISCGLGNDYNHPSSLVIDRLKSLNIKILRTDTMGTVVIKSNGKKIISP